MKSVKNPAFQRWDMSHSPNVRPLGCNDKYGSSGRETHKYRSEPVCQKCRDSFNHYRRELKRGQPMPRKLQPCGTRPAAQRHRAKGEELCFPCKVAEANSRSGYYAKEKC